VTFFPMHLLGLRGMPRRVYTYQAGLGWDTLNLVATLGSWIIALSALLFVANALRRLRRGAPAGPNPWGAGTLEWATESPPPPCNFHAIPVVHGRDPLWEPPRAAADGQPPPFTHVGGLAAHTRELLATTVLDARPDLRVNFPDPTIWPLVSALAVTVLFIGSIFTPWAVVWGSIPIAIALTAWFWPRRAETAVHLRLEQGP